MYDMIYNSGMNVSDALDKIEIGFPDCEEKKTILEFIRNSSRGIIKGPSVSKTGEMD